MRKFLIPRVRASFLSDKCGNLLQYLQYISWAFVYVDNFWEAEKRKVDDEPTDPETPINKDLKYDREKQTRIFQNLWIEYRSVQDVYYRS
jgi:hypothetical protein